MSIFKRGSKYWFHFWFNGSHVQRSTSQGNPRVARQLEAAYRTKLAKGEFGIHDMKSIPTIDEALTEFLLWSKMEHASHPRTQKRYETSSKALLRHFKKKRLDDITISDVEGFKTQRSNQSGRRTHRPIRPATINRELACGKAMYNFVIKSGVLLRNPFTGVKFLTEDNEQTRVLSYREERLYLAEASQPLRDIATLMLETGMRPEEVYSATAANVDLKNNRLFNPLGKTKAARRKIVLTSRAAQVLQVRLTAAAGKYLFPHQKNPDKPMLKVSNAHQGAVKRGGFVPFRLYDLRHTWATRAAMSGMDLVTLAAMLGHSRIQMVLRYAHPTAQHQAAAMQRLEEFNDARQLDEYQRSDRQPLHISLQ